MFLFPEIAKTILSKLDTAQKAGKPITLAAAMAKWGNGSTWEDLVDQGFVCRLPEAVTVTQSGLKWLRNPD
jgi:hypothetical protein